MDPLACIQHTTNAVKYARRLAEKVKENVKRAMFQIAIQAIIKNKVCVRTLRYLCVAYHWESIKYNVPTSLHIFFLSFES